ncbi:hypothetical protein NDU88_000218 [Pleurodeles waltl]|uniref:Uncharacterized protein n=1 Tax=Pleurodeles waltl TaxID=8319 RepID=A0AAV7V6D9_PLEWA|nr:hypothetical protein NDU88_000218 [Pleurodeles waltl]
MEVSGRDKVIVEAQRREGWKSASLRRVGRGGTPAAEVVRKRSSAHKSTVFLAGTSPAHSRGGARCCRALRVPRAHFRVTGSRHSSFAAPAPLVSAAACWGRGLGRLYPPFRDVCPGAEPLARYSPFHSPRSSAAGGRRGRTANRLQGQHRSDTYLPAAASDVRPP